MRAKALTFDGFRTITISPIVLKVLSIAFFLITMEIFYFQQITSLASKKFRLQPRYLCCIRSIIEYFTRYASRLNDLKSALFQLFKD